MLQEIIDEETDENCYDDDGDDDEYNRNDDSDLVNSKTINDILKYGAGHHSMDSNPGETQSEWSDEDEKEDDEAKGTKFRLVNAFTFYCKINYLFPCLNQVVPKVPVTLPMNQA